MLLRQGMDGTSPGNKGEASCDGSRADYEGGRGGLFSFRFDIARNIDYFNAQKDAIKCTGVPVTFEEFSVWKIDFDKTIAASLAAIQHNKDPKMAGRLTGRALFESDKNRATEDAGEEDGKRQFSALLFLLRVIKWLILILCRCRG